MFLDEMLLEECRNSDLKEVGSLDVLNRNLCKMCEKYYKDRLSDSMTPKEVKALLDRTFNLWDSFLKMAQKEGGELGILADLFSEYSFKKQFLANEKINEVYKNL